MTSDIDKLPTPQETLEALKLHHSGVKGMKWGVRKTASAVGSAAKTTARVAVKTTKVALGASAVAALGVGALGVTAAMNHPDFGPVVGIGKEYAKAALHESGLNRMSTLEQMKSVATVKRYEIEGNLN